jgi:hypothetical protein
MNHKLAEAPQPADNIVIWPCELHRDKSFTISVTQPSVPPRQVCPVCEPNYWQPQDAPVEPAPPAQPTPLTDEHVDDLTSAEYRRPTCVTDVAFNEGVDAMAKAMKRAILAAGKQP